MKEFKMQDYYKDYMPIFDAEKRLKFNDLVIIGPTTTPMPEIHKFGKIIQIRKGSGIAGTDTFLIRHCDGELSSHENQFLYSVSELAIDILNKMFEESDLYEDDDGEDIEYSICGKSKASGFIVTGLPKSEEILTFGIIITKED